jgi:hypothetical protein
MTAIYEATGDLTIAPSGRVRAILICPWSRGCRIVEVPTLAHGIDGRAISSILGRAQRCHLVLDGSENLIVGEGLSAPRWSWGTTIECTGFGILLGGDFRTGFASSQAALHEAEHFITFPPRRRRARAAA